MKKVVLLTCLSLTLVPSSSAVLQAAPQPGLASSSYFGRFGQDEATDVAVDANGFVYLVGMLETFGTTGFDAYVLKLTPDGSQVVYTTLFRGSGFEIALGIAVDGTGTAYVVGNTTSSDFPLVMPFQSTPGGGGDAWIARLDPSGTLVYSSYYGGSSFENGYALALGPSGEVYIAGSTGSADLPGINGPQPAHGGGFEDGFVVKVGADGTGVEYATYLGGSGNDTAFRIAVDSGGQAYVVGQTSSPNFPVAAAFQPFFGGGFNDGFVTKLTPDGSALVFSTYLGGVDRDIAVGLVVDAEGAVHVAGSTSSFNFPTMNAYQPFLAGGFADAFLARFQPDGRSLVFSTFLGGQGADVAVELAADAEGNLYVAGETDSSDFPLVEPVQPQVNGIDSMVMQLSGDGQTLVQSTPLGGTGLDVATGLAFSLTGEVWVVGRTDSTDFPLVSAFQPFHAGSVDAFVSRLGTPPSNNPPTASAGTDIEVTATGCAAQVLLDGTGSSDPDGDLLTFEWSGIFGTVSGATLSIELPPGTHTITLTVNDGRGGTASDEVIVTVHPDTPPQLAGATATPNVLTPADHRMVPVTIGVDLTGGCASETTCRIVSVVSSEPTSGLGRDDLAPDWTITGPLTLLLRAEHGPRSLGRLYLIVVECEHTSGVTSRTATLVVVPR